MTTFAMSTSHPAVRALLGLAGAGKGSVVVDDEVVVVRWGRAWTCEVPRHSISSARREHRRPLSLGAHGWRGRWLVNTARGGLVRLTIEPAARGRCLAVPITVRELTVSVEDPDALVSAVSRG